jgi:hypothetical protein
VTYASVVVGTDIWIDVGEQREYPNGTRDTINSATHEFKTPEELVRLATRCLEAAEIMRTRKAARRSRKAR